MITKQDDTPVVNKYLKRIVPLRAPNFPNVDDMVKQVWMNTPRPENAVDVLLVNPPSPDSELWKRSRHRVGRRTREKLVWPQVSLAQMAALLVPTYSVKVIDANAERMGWSDFISLMEQSRPKYYLTQTTAPTLENDMFGCFLAKARGAKTIAFGTHITPIPRETMRTFPDLDFVLVGEPDLTLRDLLDYLEGKVGIRPPNIVRLFKAHDPTYPPPTGGGRLTLHEIKGLAWCDGDKIVVNPPRPFVRDLDDLPVPLHELLPLQKYRMPLVNGPFATIVTSRGCPAGCTFCIKHVAYQYNIRMRSPKLIMEEMWHLKSLGISNVRMYSDLFTADRDQVMELCERMIEEKINIKWMCNSRVDFVDEEMLALMWKAGCWLITWEIESADEQILKHVHMGISPEGVERAILWSKKNGIMNWGYFILGLPGESEESINETIRFAKKLPLDIALFHVAIPYPGTPFFFEVVDKGWFRPGTRWGQVDIDQDTVLDYPGLTAERILYWQKRAFREWAFRPKPLLTYLKMLTSDFSTFQSAISVGLQNLSWPAKT
jgi:anaerobic magnesium-protoporphyrin IX monomethyl ester cyclase